MRSFNLTMQDYIKQNRQMLIKKGEISQEFFLKKMLSLFIVTDIKLIKNVSRYKEY